MIDSKTQNTGKSSALRKLAEQKEAQSPGNTKPLSPEETQRILYELRVHQIELEMQNEELRASQAELDAARTRYFDLYDLAPAGYFTISEKGVVLEANLTAAILFGEARGLLVKRPFSQFIINEDQDIYYLYRDQLLETKEPQSCELRMLKKDGTVFWANLSATVMVDDAGATMYRIVLIDISERKKDENTFMRMAQEWQRTFDSMSEAVWILDKDQRVLRSNKAAEAYFHKPCTEMVGKHCWEIVHGTTEPIPECPTMRARKSLHRESMDLQIGNGWFAITVDPILDANDEFAGAIHVVNDITERKKAEEALRTSEREFRSLAESMPQIVWITRPDGWTIYFNQQWVEYTGLTLEESYGHGWNIPFHPDDRDRAWEAWQNATQNDATYSLECRLRRFDGTYRWWLIRGVPLRDGSGKILKWFGTCTDIEDIKQAEEEKSKLGSQLRQSQKMDAVGQLAGGVAHDFNNMLSVINGYSDMLLGEMNPSDPKYARVQEINKAGTRSSELTQHLLAFARKQTIAPKVLDLNVSVSGMLKMLQRLIGENIKLIWEPSANIWKVKMDPSQIDQILANLIVNTRDAISDIGKVIIETGNAELDEAFCKGHLDFIPGKYVVLSVSDNGCGMSKEILEHIFEPFYTTKELGKGTGLGLATVFGIVKQNNGFINVYSEPGKGTAFKIYLPRHESEIVGQDDKNEKAKRITGTETVLLVEDESSLLQFAKALLEQLGYTVLYADSPVKAIKIAGEYNGDIHLLMTDVIMPEMSGLELSDRISSRRHDIKCLFMSGYSSDIMNNGILDEGIHFLQKPFTAESLSVKVREALA
jgi:PAS domain S-box-containing protein